MVKSKKKQKTKQKKSFFHWLSNRVEFHKRALLLDKNFIMSLASAAGVLLKPQTPLQQLLEDINFQRTKEMRQLLKDGKLQNLN